VRTLKRELRVSSHTQPSDADQMLSRESAAALLSRSIRFGHGRLAVLRLAIAVDVGASIPQEHWTYCLRAAQLASDAGLQELYRAAAVKAYGAETPNARTATA
jgi:hypothetical protein